MIKKATIDDLAAIVEAWRRFTRGLHLKHEPSQKDFEFWLLSLLNSDTNVVIEVQRKKVIGLSRGFIIRRLNLEDSLMITELFTRDRKDKKRIIKNLLSAQETFAKNMGVSKIELMLKLGEKAPEGYNDSMKLLYKEVS